MMLSAQKTDLIKLNNNQSPCPPISSSFLSQFTNWAKIWMSSPTKKSTPRKRKIISVDNHPNTGEADVRCKSSFGQPHQYYHQQPLHIPNSQKASLYHATCQKLRPSNHSQTTKLQSLGDIIHVRKFWDHLERLVYQELSNTSHYVAPSKRLPFNPDKPSWLYKKKASSRRHNLLLNPQNIPKRKSFASSTIVYIPSPRNNNSKSVNIEAIPIIHRQVPQVQPHYNRTKKSYITEDDDDDDDDVPLGALLRLSNSKSSPSNNDNFSFKRK